MCSTDTTSQGFQSVRIGLSAPKSLASSRPHRYQSCTVQYCASTTSKSGVLSPNYDTTIEFPISFFNDGKVSYVSRPNSFNPISLMASGNVIMPTVILSEGDTFYNPISTHIARPDPCECCPVKIVIHNDSRNHHIHTPA